MNYKLQVRQLAAREIIEAYDWYELQKEGLGEVFLTELDIFYESLFRNPFTYSFYQEPIRQGKIGRFPYVLVFEVVENTIVVYSVFMTKRNSDYKKDF
jgi:plasmid stabilization system protein ParE